MQNARPSRPLNSGHAVIEVSFLAPWIFFLFAGAFDVGVYTHALISAQNAARVAATYTSRSALTASDSSIACAHALEELKGLANVRQLSTCNAAPLQVTAQSVTGTDGAPASSVSVRYVSDKLIPIPGLMGQLDVTRTVQMRVK